MPYKISSKQIEEVCKLSHGKRYEHLIKRIADSEELWTLKAIDGFVTVGDEEGNICIPIWPHSEYARLYAIDEFAEAEPEKIELKNWMEKWIPGMQNDGYIIAGFPVQNSDSAHVQPSEHLEHLKQELSIYE